MGMRTFPVAKAEAGHSNAAPGYFGRKVSRGKRLRKRFKGVSRISFSIIIAM
jgi:hypothetical protein